MDNPLNVALVQTSLVWESPMENRRHISDLLAQVKADMIVLPEMFSTGFTMGPAAVAETMEGETVQWMKSWAREKSAAICGSVVIHEDVHYYNRLLFVHPSGEIQYYDKRHLFSLAGEDQVYSTKGSRLIVDYRGWKICPLICYDLRFPVFSRNDVDYDLLLYVANWPQPRISAWDALLKARAIENMCYVVAVNRIGTDQNGHSYPGHSQILDYFGNVVQSAGNEAVVKQSTIDRSAMLQARQKLPFLNDRDDFTVR